MSEFIATCARGAMTFFHGCEQNGINCIPRPQQVKWYINHRHVAVLKRSGLVKNFN
jgi:hypothetical protein